MNYDYIIEDHPDFDSKGMRPLFLMNGEPAQALQATHDLLEHFLEPITSNAELKALGAMLYVRGNIPNIISGLASDFGTVLSYQDSFDPVSDPGPTRPVEDGIESCLTQAIAKFYQDYSYELEENPQDKNYPHWLRGWVRIGYRQARKRYKLEPKILSYHFDKIQGEFEKQLKWAELGDIIRINLVRSTMDYKIYLISQYDPEHPNYVELGEE